MKMEFANDPQFIEAMQADLELKELRQQMVLKIAKYKYSYNFTWCGRPIIQLPDDMMTLQEIVWEVQPDLIVETGIAHGGSLIYYASMLEIIRG